MESGVGREEAAGMNGLLLRSGAGKTIQQQLWKQKSAADEVEHVAEGMGHRVVARVSRMHKLLANAPVDRVWRRQGFLVLCHAHHMRLRVSDEEAGCDGWVGGFAKVLEFEGGVFWNIVRYL